MKERYLLVGLLFACGHRDRDVDDLSPQFIARFDLDVEATADKVRVVMDVPAEYRSSSLGSIRLWHSKGRSESPTIRVLTKSYQPDTGHHDPGVAREHPCGAPPVNWDDYRDTIRTSVAIGDGFMVTCDRDRSIDSQHREVYEHRVARVMPLRSADLWCIFDFEAAVTASQLENAKSICRSMHGRVWEWSSGDPTIPSSTEPVLVPIDESGSATSRVGGQ